jgi:UDP-4-amino-4,6-dideoxy-N-acetyl-beta-L-altrosamine transaminase
VIIPYGRQSIDESDVAAVDRVLRSDWLTQGPTIESFEHAIADAVHARHAVAFSSGTAALHGAAAVAEFAPGDVVVTSPLTFMASANCARYVGATPALVDIDPATWNLDVRAVGAGFAGVVAVHYAGLPAPLEQLVHRPRVVIEDAAHALGATTPDGPVGNCARSDMCCFSLHPVKPITTGEGGIVTTNDDELADRLRRFRSHDIVRRPEQGGWYYEISGVGFNYRMTDIHAALGLSQLAKLDRFVARRNELAQRYRQVLDGLPIELPPTPPAGYTHAYHLFPVLVEERRRVFDGLRAAGIATQVHYVPVHHHPVSSDLGLAPGDLPVCDRVYDRILSLPMYPTLTEQQQDHVAETLTSLL